MPVSRHAASPTRTARDKARLPRHSPSLPFHSARTGSITSTNTNTTAATTTTATTTAVPAIYCSPRRVMTSNEVKVINSISNSSSSRSVRRPSHAESSRSTRPPRPVLPHSASQPQPDASLLTMPSSSRHNNTMTNQTTSSRTATRTVSPKVTVSQGTSTQQQYGCCPLRTPPQPPPPTARSTLLTADSLNSHAMHRQLASVSARLQPSPASFLSVQQILRHAQQQAQTSASCCSKTLMVGHAVVNPNATLALPVQRGVRQIVRRMEPTITTSVLAGNVYTSQDVMSTLAAQPSGYLRCKERPTCLPTIILSVAPDTLSANTLTHAAEKNNNSERVNTPLGTMSTAPGSLRARTRLRLGYDATTNATSQQQQQQELKASRMRYRRWSGSLPEIATLEVSSQELMSTTLFHSMTGDLTRMPHFAPYAGYDSSTMNNVDADDVDAVGDKEDNEYGGSRHYNKNSKRPHHHHRHTERTHNLLPTALQQALASIGITEIQVTRSPTCSVKKEEGEEEENNMEDRDGMRALRRLYHTVPGEDCLVGSTTLYASRSSRTMTVQPTATMAHASSSTSGLLPSASGVTRRLLRQRPLSPGAIVQRQLDKLRNPYIQDTKTTTTTGASARKAPLHEWDAKSEVYDHVLDLLRSPTAPTIAFLDTTGQPVQNVSVLHYSLDPVTLHLQHNSVGQNAVRCVGTQKHLLFTSNKSNVLSAHMSGNNACTTVGVRVSYDGLQHRIVGLVGLLPGEAERLGLQRVMVYRVDTSAAEMFCVPPRIEPASGDLLLQFNARCLKSSVTLTITASDAAALDPNTLQLMSSVNTLSCVVETAFKPCATCEPQRRIAQRRPSCVQVPCSAVMNSSENASNKEERKAEVKPYVMPHTNPCSLFYGDCSESAQEVLRTSPTLSTLVNNNKATSVASTPAAAAAAVTATTTSPHNRANLSNSNEDVERQLRQPLTHSLWYETSKVHMVCMLLRLVDWQRRFSELFRSAAEEAAVNDAQHRSQFKKRAWQELQNLRHAEQHPLSAQPFTMSIDEDNNKEEEEDVEDDDETNSEADEKSRQWPHSVTVCPKARPQSRQSGSVQRRLMQTLRHLLLCLLLEPSRASPRLFFDVVDLCAQLSRHALLRTTSCTGGSTAGLARAATQLRAPCADYYYQLVQQDSTTNPNNARPLSRPTSPRDAAGVTFALHTLFSPATEQPGQNVTTITSGSESRARGRSTPSPATSRTASPPRTTSPSPPPPLVRSLHGSHSLTDNERARLDELEDALSVTLTACMLIGAFDAAVVYATQRLHVRYLREAGGSRAGCTALRDVVEALYFYGDYGTALSVARDLLAQTGQYYSAQSSEQAEAELLYCLCYLADAEMTMNAATHGTGVSVADAAGRRAAVLDRLRARFRPQKQQLNSNSSDMLPLLLRVQLRYVWVAAHAEAELMNDGTCMPTSLKRPNSAGWPTVAAMRAIVEEAIALCEKGSIEAGVEAGSPVSGVIAGVDRRGSISTTQQDTSRARLYTRTMKLLLRFFLGGLLCKLHATERGQAVIHAVVPQLVASAKCEEEVEGQMKAAAALNRQSLGAGVSSSSSQQKQQLQLPTAGLIMWSVTALWRLWACPSEHPDTVAVLRRLARQLTRLKGPYYLLAGLMHICVARETHDRAPPYALHLTQRALSVMRHTLHTRSVILHLARGLALRVHLGFGHWRYALEQVGQQVSAMQGVDYTVSNHGPELNLAAAQPVLYDVMLTLLACPAAQTTLHVALDVFLPCLQACVRQHEQRCGAHDASLVRPLFTLAMGYYLLSCWSQAEQCMERAVRIVDSKGMLQSEEARALLRPLCTIPPIGAYNGVQQVSREVWARQRREKVLSAMNHNRPNILALAQLLFALAAVQEARLATQPLIVIGEAAQTVEHSYGQALALLESVDLQDSLCAVRIYTALARLAFTMEHHRVAFAWGYKAQRVVHAHFRHISREVTAVRTLMHVIEHRVYETEGTYLMVRPSYLVPHNTDNHFIADEEDDVQIW